MLCHVRSNCRSEENAGDILKVQSHRIGNQVNRAPLFAPSLQQELDPRIAASLQPGAIPGG